MSLLIDTNTPLKFSDFIINKKLADKLKIKNKNQTFLNTFISGLSGSGKYTLAMALLNEYYGEEVYNKKESIFKLKIGTNIKEISIKHSHYHYEIFINNYLFNDKTSLILLLQQISENINIKTKSYNIILLKNIETIPTSCLYSLKNIIETNFDSCRFILVSTSTYKFTKIRHLFLNIRIPNPNKDEIKLFIEKNNLNIANIDQYLKNHINKITGTNNLSKLFTSLEMQLINKKKYRCPLEVEINSIINILNKKDISSILKLREQLYKYNCQNFNKNLIFSYVCNYYTSSNIENNKKRKIIELSAKYQHRLVNSYRELIHLEAYLINVLNVLI